MTRSTTDSNHHRRLFNVSAAYRSRIWVAVAWMLAGVSIAGLLPAGDLRQWLGPVAIACGIGIGLGRVRASRMAAERALAEEQRWLEALPFRLDGWWAVLADDFERPSEAAGRGLAYVRVRVAIDFDKAAPEPKLFHERLLAARVVELRALEVGDGGFELTLGVPKSSSPSGVVSAVHRLVDEALLPLHRVHPLSRVLLFAIEPR